LASTSFFFPCCCRRLHFLIARVSITSNSNQFNNGRHGFTFFQKPDAVLLALLFLPLCLIHLRQFRSRSLPPRPHVLLLILWPPSAFFFHLFATVSNIVICEILLGATTRLSRATLRGYKELGQNFVEHTLSVRSTSAGRPAVSVCSAAAVVPPPSKSTIRTPMAVPPIDPPSNRNRKKK
ncbi:hypothetical protein S83_019753, partial [Arachis hypogaea]